MSDSSSQARDPSFLGEQLRALRTVFDPALDRLLARHPNSPPELLEELSHSSDAATRRQVVRHHSKTPLEVLRALANDPVPDVRVQVAQRPDAPEDILVSLAQDVDRQVLLQLASRAKLPDAVLGAMVRTCDLLATEGGQLVRASTHDVRLALAARPDLPQELTQALLAGLGADSSPRVRLSAARHARAHAELLDRLADDDDLNVRVAASERRSRDTWSDPFEDKPAFQKLVEVAVRLLKEDGAVESDASEPESTWTPGDLLVGLYGLQLVPKQPSERFLAQAVYSKDWLTRLAVALHPAATPTQLELLDKDEVREVVAAVRSRATKAWPQVLRQ